MTDLVPSEELQGRIYRIRGKPIMLDGDLAFLYGVTTKRLNEQVRRNIRRFPSDFMFQLTTFEVEILRSQIATLRSPGHGKHRKYWPYAFTEQGVAMLSSVLRSERAVDVNIAIMRAFVKLRHALGQNRGMVDRVEKIEGRLNLHETDIRILTKDVKRLENQAPNKVIRGFADDEDR